MNQELIDDPKEIAAAHRREAESLVHSLPPEGLTEVEMQQLAERVYRLMREQARLESARNGEFAGRR